MAKGFKHGAGGGSIGLNFKVVAYATEEELNAATAKENTIGVITSNKITGWDFSATEPTVSMEGMVWIATGTSSANAFNALKKNGIQVYPLSVKQYVGGAWVKKSSKIGKNGVWKTTSLPLYINGNEYTDTTGGWKGSKPTAGNVGTPVVTKSATSMSVSLTGNWVGGYLHTANKIDVTNYSTLRCKFGEILNPFRTIFGVFSAFDNDNYNWPAFSIISNTGESVVDISAISGLYYIGFQLDTGEQAQNKHEMYINDITSIIME